MQEFAPESDHLGPADAPSGPHPDATIPPQEPLRRSIPKLLERPFCLASTSFGLSDYPYPRIHFWLKDNQPSTGKSKVYGGYTLDRFALLDLPQGLSAPPFDPPLVVFPIREPHGPKVGLSPVPFQTSQKPTASEVEIPIRGSL